MKSLSKALVCLYLSFMITAPASSQEVLLGVDFETYFDNREYSMNEEMREHSGSDFAASILPTLGVRFDQYNTLFFGAEIIQPFGKESSKFIDEVFPIIYYGLDTQRWSLTAGLFPRNRMSIDSYSSAFFVEDYLFYDNIVSGVMGRYSVEESFVEFVCDWEGQKSTTTREKFRLLSSARRQWSKLFVGYALSVTHFAGQEAEGFTNVVDNILLNPFVGVRLQGNYNFEAKLSYLQSMQRDRSYENEWLSPAMGEVALNIERWGVSIDERFYFGDDLMPLYDGHTLEDGTFVEYGEQLYTGDPFFRTTGGFYNRAAVSYTKRLFEDKVRIKAEFVTHATSLGLVTQQLLNIDVRLGTTIYKRRK